MMPRYRYTVTDLANENQKAGEITAKSEKEARLTLKGQGHFVLSLKVIKEKKEGGFDLNMNLVEKKVKIEELTIFSRQFATLIDAGIPIPKSLKILADSTVHPTLKKALKQMTEDIENGNKLSFALQKHPKIFPTIYVDMVRAAELSGSLASVLDRLAGYMEKDKSLKAKVKSAFIYPTVVVSIVFIAIIVILKVVVPSFMPMFEELGSNLPLPTRMLLMGSNIVENYWWAILLALVGVFVAYKGYTKTAKGKRQMDYIKLKMPIFGQITTKTSIARFSRTLETLQKSGVSLMESLEIVSRTSGNIIVEEALLSAIDYLERGEGIHTALREHKIFPPLVVQMIEIGEQTGELEKLLGKVADFYEEEVDIAVKNLTALMEPLITVVLGVIVCFIALSVMMPMYQMMGDMQQDM